MRLLWAAFACWLAAAASATAGDITKGVVRIAAPPDANTLRLRGDVLSYCSNKKSQQITLTNVGQPAIGVDECPEAPGNGCDAAGTKFEIRSAADATADVVAFDAGSVTLKGRVQACAAFGSALAVATATQVLIIDSKTRKTQAVEPRGADSVALGKGWIAWSDRGAIGAKRR